VLARLPRDQALALMGSGEAAVTTGVPYGQRDGLDEVNTPTGRVVFDGKHVAVVYISGRALAPTSPPDLLIELGGPGEELPGAGGPGYELHVYPDQGLAFSHDADRLDFVEAFPPTTLSGYRATLYRTPPSFIA
jgi:hypothetical protein